MKPPAEILFSETAIDFDSQYETSPAFKERFRIWTQMIDQYLTPPGKALDLGCGSGIFSFYLAKRGFDVTGIDGAVNMIDLCRKKQLKYGIANTNFILSKIPLSDMLKNDSYDAIISSSVLEYIEDLDQVLKDVNNMLKPGGIFIVSMPNKLSWYRKMEQVSLKLINRPIYLKYVHHILSVSEFNERVCRNNFNLVSTRYYASHPVLRKLLPIPAASTLFISVFKK